MSNTLATYIETHISDADLAAKVASFLIENKLTLNLESLMRDVMTIREQKGIYEVVLTTAHDISAEQEKQVVAYIKQVLSNVSDVVLIKKVDPSVLGGVRIESANYLIDKSLKAKLHYIKSSVAV